MKSFEAKLGSMRKAQTFVVYPRKSSGEPIIIQSDRAIGMFDPVTGAGRLNTRGSYFHHLDPGLGAALFQFPPDVVKAAMEAGEVTPDGSVRLV